ncbi:MAG: hypothetical protein WC528_03245 [Patescibacteria group bacterium]
MRSLAIFLGLALVVFVSAQIAQATQVINDSLQVNSLEVGLQGVGGVTFFNGTIVNSTTTSGADNPVAFGDNVRIDGRIYRGATPGTSDTMPFIINDNLEVAGSLTVASIDSRDVVTSANIKDETITADDMADNAITSAKISAGAVATTDLANNAVTSAKIASETITSSDIKNGSITGDDFDTDTNLTVDGLSANDSIYTNFIYADGAYFSGDVVQWDYTGDGTVHAAFWYDPANIYMSSFGDPAVSVKNGVGDYSFTFSNLDVYDERFFQITPVASASNTNCVGYADVASDISGKTLRVKCYVANTGAATDSYLQVAIF